MLTDEQIKVFKTSPKSPKHELEYHRIYKIERAEKRKAYAKAYRQRPDAKQKNKERNSRNKAKNSATAVVRIRIQKGTLKRGNCVFCGEPNVHAHHEDYTKRYEIVWVCRRHHADIHANRITVLPSQIVTIPQESMRWKKK